MSPIDVANAVFEIGGGLVQLSSCQQLMRDKSIRGVNPWVTAFFFSWGIWNLVFYPIMHAPLSALGAGCLVLANGIWLGLAYHYAGDKFWKGK